MTSPANTERYKYHRFPGAIINHGVWLFDRFPWFCQVVEAETLITHLFIIIRATSRDVPMHMAQAQN
jgi:hypothetical protein